MKRDMNLVRQILLCVEDSDQDVIHGLDIDNFTESEIGYNVELLINAGILSGFESQAFGRRKAYYIQGITWQGHDFLDAIRADSIWDKVNKAVSDKGLNLNELSFEIVKKLAIDFLSNGLGI